MKVVAICMAFNKQDYIALRNFVQYISSVPLGHDLNAQCVCFNFRELMSSSHFEWRRCQVNESGPSHVPPGKRKRDEEVDTFSWETLQSKLNSFSTAEKFEVEGAKNDTNKITLVAFEFAKVLVILAVGVWHAAPNFTGAIDISLMEVDVLRLT